MRRVVAFGAHMHGRYDLLDTHAAPEVDFPVGRGACSVSKSNQDGRPQHNRRARSAAQHLCCFSSIVLVNLYGSPDVNGQDDCPPWLCESIGADRSGLTLTLGDQNTRG